MLYFVSDSDFKILLSSKFSPTGVGLYGYKTFEQAKYMYEKRISFEKKEILYRLKNIIHIRKNYIQIQIDISKNRTRKIKIMQKYFETHYK